MTTIERCSGILLHITSLPSRFGIGDMGPGARRFADFLQSAQQRLWQILPLNPTHPNGDYSPYYSWSAFAGNTLLISPEQMVQDGFIEAGDLDPSPRFKARSADYPTATSYKNRLFDIAFRRFKAKSGRRAREAFGRFCQSNAAWLDDAARFKVLQEHFRGQPWQQWPDPLKRRRKSALRQIERHLKAEIQKEKFLQFLFDTQWRDLRHYCTEKEVQLFGDIPIYVNGDSADVWAHPDLFQLDDDLWPAAVSGVPPDYFSATGQLWGHPVYAWQQLQTTGYRWWLHRIGHNLDRFDWIRIDHFRGLVAFWEVPAHHTTAMDGRWTAAPAEEFLACLLRRYPLMPMVAEDLGVITADVREILQRFDIPGMRVALFAFGADFPQSPYLPHQIPPHCAFFTGTHDTNTVKGWFQSEATAAEKRRLKRYLGYPVSDGQVHWDLIRMVMQSPARMALVPMQDVLGLGRTARMNRPGKAHGNWRWRVDPRRLTKALAHRLRQMAITYGRG
jgi:4-alpha-glucanotransferase